MRKLRPTAVNKYLAQDPKLVSSRGGIVDPVSMEQLMNRYNHYH